MRTPTGTTLAFASAARNAARSGKEDKNMAGSCFWPEPFRPHVFLYTETSASCQRRDEKNFYAKSIKAKKIFNRRWPQMDTDMLKSNCRFLTPCARRQKPRVELPVFDAAKNG
jgi:hypothetical protein